MDEKKIELKPCPFCGGEAFVAFCGKSSVAYWRGVILVKCEFCGAASKGVFYEGPPIEAPLTNTIGAEKAAAYWNRRSDNGNNDH